MPLGHSCRYHKKRPAIHKVVVAGYELWLCSECEMDLFKTGGGKTPGVGVPPHGAHGESPWTGVVADDLPPDSFNEEKGSDD